MITEGYFGAELEPFDIIETKYEKIYVCKLIIGDNRWRYVYYDSLGQDPMELSSINIEEFEEIYKDKKKERR